MEAKPCRIPDLETAISEHSAIFNYLADFTIETTEPTTIDDLFNHHAIKCHIREYTYLTPIFAQHYYFLLYDLNRSGFNQDNKIYNERPLTTLMLKALQLLSDYYIDFIMQRQPEENRSKLRDQDAEHFLCLFSKP